jgi:hypothetical protein
VIAGLIALVAAILFFCRRYPVQTRAALRLEFLKATLPARPVNATPKEEGPPATEWDEPRPSVELAMMKQVFEQNVHLRERLGETRPVIA